MAEKKPDWAKVNEDGSVTITLTRPIEINGAKVGYVTMREPTVDDETVASEIRGSEAAKERALFGNLCTIAPADLGKMAARDYRRIQAAYTANFFD
jgi:hypothetical protein